MVERGNLNINSEEAHEKNIVATAVESVLRRSSDIDSLVAACKFSGLYPAEIARFLKHEEIANALLDRFSSTADLYRYQLALAGSSSGFESLSQEVKEKLRVVPDESQLEVEISHFSWDLCYRSEDYMNRALKKGRVLKLNGGNILVKANGYKTALVLETFATDKALFVEGNWYSPVGEAKEMVKEAFLNGEEQIHLDKGSFVLMRSIADGRKGRSTMERSRRYVHGEATPSRLRRVVGDIRERL